MSSFLNAEIVPTEQVIDIGRQARLECLSETRMTDHVTWMKDGKLLPNRTRIVVTQQTLQIFNLQREDYGMYQCFVQGKSQSEVQASSELRLGGMCQISSWLVKQIRELERYSILWYSSSSYYFLRRQYFFSPKPLIFFLLYFYTSLCCKASGYIDNSMTKGRHE